MAQRRNPLSIELVFPFPSRVVSLQLLQNTLSLVFISSIMLCLGMDFLGLFYLGFTQFLEISGFICFAMFGKFSAIISLNIVSTLLTFFPGTPVIQILDLLLFSHRSLRLCSFYFFSIFSLLFRLGKFCLSVCKFTDSVLCHLYFTVETSEF